MLAMLAKLDLAQALVQARRELSGGEWRRALPLRLEAKRATAAGV
jgi:ABC-type cobalamin transport system ATPase subunit